MICQRAVYSGNVQGVGFRYTTLRLAAGHAVKGYVRNLPDGRVEVIAEGKPDDIRSFLEAISQEMSGHIRGIQVHDEPCTRHYDSFGIRY